MPGSQAPLLVAGKNRESSACRDAHTVFGRTASKDKELLIVSFPAGDECAEVSAASGDQHVCGADTAVQGS